MSDPIMQQYYAWTHQAEIPSTADYAKVGFLLAEQFEKMERPAMAASCRERAEQYQTLSTLISGVHRIPDGQNFVILEPINGQPVLTS